MKWLLLICLVLNGCIVVGVRNAYEIHEHGKRITALEAIFKVATLNSRLQADEGITDDTSETPNE